jgi:hypothetical protein
LVERARSTVDLPDGFDAFTGLDGTGNGVANQMLQVVEIRDDPL